MENYKLAEDVDEIQIEAEFDNESKGASTPSPNNGQNLGNIEKEAQESPRKVVTEEGLVASEYYKTGDKFKLSEMLDKKTEEDKGVAYVLFSTVSENSYLLTPDGRMISGNKGQEKELDTEKARILNSEVEVGSSFFFPDAWRTTRVKSILVVTNEKYSSDEMGEVAKTQMVEDFKKKIETLSPDDRQSLENILRGEVK